MATALTSGSSAKHPGSCQPCARHDLTRWHTVLPPGPAAEHERAAEARLRAFLGCDPLIAFEDVPASATAKDALAWAVSLSPAARSSTPYRGLPHVHYWGRPMRPADACAAIRDATDEGDSRALDQSARRRDAPPPSHSRGRRARRRQRHRDVGVGTDEPQESVEDPFGLRRPTDCADNADPEGLGDSLSELPEARVVRTGGRVRRSSALERTCREPWAQPAYGTPGGSRISRVGLPFGHIPSAGCDRTRGRWTPWRFGVGDVRTCASRAPHPARPHQVRAPAPAAEPVVRRQPDGPELDIPEDVEAAADARAWSAQRNLPPVRGTRLAPDATS